MVNNKETELTIMLLISKEELSNVQEKENSRKENRTICR